MSSPILNFYRLEAPDSEGRMLEDYWQWDNDTLEHVHDFIQWMFPLAESSAFNADAPLLTQDDKTAFRREPLLQSSMRRSLNLFLNFLGLAMRKMGKSFVSRSSIRELRCGSTKTITGSESPECSRACDCWDLKMRPRKSGNACENCTKTMALFPQIRFATGPRRPRGSAKSEWE